MPVFFCTVIPSVDRSLAVSPSPVPGILPEHLTELILPEDKSDSEQGRGPSS